MQPYEVTASTVNEICPAIETWETGNRWLSKGKREEKIEAGEHRREEQDDKMAKPEREKGLPRAGLTRAFSACTTRWRRPPAVPAAAAGTPG